MVLKDTLKFSRHPVIDWPESRTGMANEYHFLQLGLSNSTFPSAQCVKPLRNLEIKNLSEMNTSSPILLNLNCFRQEIFENNISSVSLSFIFLVRVEYLQLKKHVQ